MNKSLDSNRFKNWLNNIYDHLGRLSKEHKLPTKIYVSVRTYRAIEHYCKLGCVRNGTFISHPASNNVNPTIYIYGIEVDTNKDIHGTEYRLSGKQYWLKDKSWMELKAECSSI